jgi:predicted ester cyclase
MNYTEIRKLVSNFFESVNNKEFEKLKSFLSAEAILHFPGTKPITGAEKVIQFLRIIYRKFPDLTFEIKDIIIDDDKIAAVWENSGTDTANNLYKNQGVTVFKIYKGKVTYLSDYFKDTSFTNKS